MRALLSGSGALVLAGLLLAVAPPVSAQTALDLGELPVGVGGTQAFAINDRVNFTMPAATGGTTPYIYTLVPSIGSTSFRGRYTGLTFDADNNRIIGVPTETSTSFGYDHIVTDSASGTAENLYRFIVGDDVTDPVVTYTVPGALVVGTAVTLPPDTDDPDTLAYAFDAATPLPPGLSLATDTGIISGAPTTVNPATTAVTITVTDTAGNDADVALTFPAVTAVPDTTDPVVSYTAPPTLTVGTSVTLSPATTDTDIASYALTSGTLPPGLALATDTGIISGAPTTANTATTDVTVTVTDNSGNTADVTLSFPAVDPAPMGLPPLSDLTFPKGDTITPVVTLPLPRGRTAPYTFTLVDAAGNLPDGMVFDDAVSPPTLGGTPTRLVSRSALLTYTVRDADGTEDSATFTVTIAGPTFLPVEDQRWDIDQAIEPLTLPIVTSGSIGTVTYTLTPAPLPAALAGLTFTAAGTPLTDGYGGILSGTPTFVATAGTPPTVLTYTATDTFDSEATSDTFSVQVVLPGLSFSATVPPLRFLPDEPISPVTLPAAMGLGTPLIYNLTPVPEGLSFDPDSRVLSGTPPMVVNQTLTYTVTDRYGTPATLHIRVSRRFDTERADVINRATLPKVGRALADQAVGAIARRIEQVHSGGGSSAGALGGQSTLAGVLGAHGSALAEGTQDLRSLLGNSDFVLPLGARGAGIKSQNGGENDGGTPATVASTMSLWGSGDYRELSDKQGSFSWDGELISAQLGVDFLLAETLLAGVAFSQSQSDVDYKDELGSGSQELDLSSVYPYLGWSAFEGRIELWATAGYGAGEVELSEDGTGDSATSDANMQTLGAGARSRLLGGSGEGGLWLKGDVFQATLEVEGSDEMSELEVDINRVRLALTSSRSYTLANGSLLEPSVEVGLRYDGGDGETGSALEVGAGMRHVNPALGLTLEGKFFSNSLEAYDSYREWGLQGSVQLARRSDGRGLFFHLSSGYGTAGFVDAQALWERDLEDLYSRRADEHRNRGMRLDARLGYGLSAAPLRRPGLLTPYSEMAFQGDTAAYHLGFHYHPTPSTELDLRWSHHDDPTPGTALTQRPSLRLSATATF